MAEFNTTLTANRDSRPLYEVTVNDGSADGGSTAQIMVGGFFSSLDHTAAETAVQALANAFADSAGYTVVRIARLNVAETVLSGG
ncbi:hypothetical protein [Streptomyces sp. NPDC054940]